MKYLIYKHTWKGFVINGKKFRDALRDYFKTSNN